MIEPSIKYEIGIKCDICGKEATLSVTGQLPPGWIGIVPDLKAVWKYSRSTIIYKKPPAPKIYCENCYDSTII